MNNHIFDIVMLAVMIPTALIMFFYEYPKNWKDRKVIFGVRNREEFKNLNNAKRVDDITGSSRKQAGIILLISLIIMGLMCLIPDFTTRMVVWTFFIMIDIFVLIIPFIRGNSEMKSLKKELGINSKGISYSEFSNAGTIHALKLSRMIIPCVVGIIVCLAALFYDMKLFSFGGRTSAGDYMISGLLASFLMVGIVMVPISIMFDRLRNDVISEDSDINANYNRAKKKNWADTNVFMIWINTAFIALTFPAMVMFQTEKVMLVVIVVYMLMLFVGLGLFVKRNLAIDKRYRRETSIETDDDDYWLLGSIYYNPEDKRLNVEKRAGVGATINMAHPVGKLIGVITVLAVIGTILVLVWVAILGKTPISLKFEDGKIICHQLNDDYVIPADSVEEIILLSGTNKLSLTRISGYNLEPIFKGNFTVEGERGCRIFLNTEVDEYLRLISDGKTYYINGNTVEETEEVYSHFIK